jgi:hypothetical protein
MSAAQWGLAGLKGRKGGGVGRIATSAAPTAAKRAASAARGGCEPQAKPAGAQGKGKLGDHRVVHS